MRRGAQFSWLPFGYWFSIDPRTFAGEATSVGDDNVELALRRALKKKAWDLLASPGLGPMRIGVCPDVSIAQGLRVKRPGDTMKGEDVELVLCCCQLSLVDERNTPANRTSSTRPMNMQWVPKCVTT